ncbi:xanthine dehydrogenase-like [Watersipora subatra]|uniref:xanthine dehydrogenase-like n=1 Tax=Watersipora subatra TaxID=2589382 RepID=UPI00355B86E5
MADSSFPVFINSRQYIVNPGQLPADYTLTDYIRDNALLKGTKIMCREGGCGLCTVTMQIGDAAPKAINSCLVPINMCSGWKITTIEGLGSEKTGYHDIQKTLADNNGSQCGYCSPGMVMAMYGKMQQAPKELPEKLEGTFDGNICRCTGYRPIMYAMHQCVKDIEDIEKCKDCPSKLVETQKSSSHWTAAGGLSWHSPISLAELKTIVAKLTAVNYYLAAGHTGVGVYKQDGPFAECIDINGVSELTAIKHDTNSLDVGAAVTLTQLMSTFEELSSTPGFEYLKDAAQYIGHMANVQIRNLGSWAGNLMMKQKHHGFASDVFILLECVGASLNVCDCVNDSVVVCTPAELLDLDMKGKVIQSMSLSVKPGWSLRCYKVTSTYRNAHSLLSLAFFVKYDDSKVVSEKPSLVYAGVSDKFIHAADVENLLLNKNLFDNATLQECMTALEKVDCQDDPQFSSVEFRKSALKSVFYKAVLSIGGSHCSPEVMSGGELLARPDISTGHQEFPTDPSQYPMTQPVPKLDARKQTSGEAQYAGDLPHMAGQLHAAFAKTTVASATIDSIDVSDALKMPGVVSVLTSKDIPGVNRIRNEEIFLCEKEVFYYGQPVAIVVAETEAEAMAARGRVKVQYSGQKTPILSIDQAIKANSFHPDPSNNILTKGNTQEAMKNSDMVISGKIETGEQYPMHLESQTCLTDPKEGFYILHAATQVMGAMQTGVAALLGIKKNEVEVRVRRVGGGFGAKQARSSFSGYATALAAYHIQRPVRMHLTIEDNMEMLGRRNPLRIDYQVGVRKRDMKLLAVISNLYENCGFYTTEAMGSYCFHYVDSAYYVPSWKCSFRQCKTNQPNHCYIRAPGILSVNHFTEQMLAEVAVQLDVSPEQVKEANLYQYGQTNPFNVPITPCYTREIWTKLKETTRFDDQTVEIAKFNLANRWRKKALSLMPLKYSQGFPANWAFLVHVSINHDDASVTVIHAGVELGQGINTKAIQVAARTLGVPLDMVRVHPPSTSYNTNSSPTAGSVSSDFNCLAVKNACDMLVARMAPYKKKKMTWEELVAECQKNQVDLHATYQVTNKNAAPDAKFDFQVYDVFGAASAEVELDVLTGNIIINRMDILYDAGASYSPEIDVGQVEGAIVMALGLSFHEEIKYSTKTGQLLTNSTWSYHVPMCRDIPVDLRVSLLSHRPNKAFALRSKVVAEPPMLLAESAVTSLRKCILEVRKDQGLSTSFTADLPLTLEKLHVACGLNSANFNIS